MKSVIFFRQTTGFPFRLGVFFAADQPLFEHITTLCILTKGLVQTRSKGFGKGFAVAGYDSNALFQRTRTPKMHLTQAITFARAEPPQSGYLATPILCKKPSIVEKP
jgi:hypothetical protein